MNRSVILRYYLRVTDRFLAMARLLTANEAASQVGISVQLLKRQIAEGKGPAVTRLGRGHSRIRVQPEALDDWIRRCTTPASAATQSGEAA